MGFGLQVHFEERKRESINAREEKGDFRQRERAGEQGEKGAAAWLFRDGVNALRSDLALKVALLLRRSRRPPFCAVEKDTVEKSTGIQNVQFGNKLNGSDGLFHFFYEQS